MNIYDNNRLTRWGRRRVHGAFEECGRSRTWTVPTIAGEIAPAVVDVEDAMLRWAKDAPRELAEVALLASWPPLGTRTGPNSGFASL